MRILVIDDNATNLAAAAAQLKGHELTAARSYDEGRELIRGKYNKETYQYDQPGQYDAVLVDLLMPASKEAQGAGMKFAGQEMPVGIFLALLAAKKGAKYAAVFTDSDHHSHPASACFDAFNDKGECDPTPFTVAGANVILCNNRNWVNHYKPDNLSRPLEFDEWYQTGIATVIAKNWEELLKYLIAVAK